MEGVSIDSMTARLSRVAVERNSGAHRVEGLDSLLRGAVSLIVRVVSRWKRFFFRRFHFGARVHFN